MVSQADLAWFKANEAERNAWRIGAKQDEPKKELEDVEDGKR